MVRPAGTRPRPRSKRRPAAGSDPDAGAVPPTYPPPSWSSAGRFHVGRQQFLVDQLDAALHVGIAFRLQQGSTAFGELLKDAAQAADNLLPACDGPGRCLPATALGGPLHSCRLYNGARWRDARFTSRQRLARPERDRRLASLARRVSSNRRHELKFRLSLARNHLPHVERMCRLRLRCRCRSRRRRGQPVPDAASTGAGPAWPT